MHTKCLIIKYMYQDFHDKYKTLFEISILELTRVDYKNGDEATRYWGKYVDGA